MLEILKVKQEGKKDYLLWMDEDDFAFLSTHALNERLKGNKTTIASLINDAVKKTIKNLKK